MIESEPWRPSLIPSRSKYKEGGSVGRFEISSSKDNRAVSVSTIAIALRDRILQNFAVGLGDTQLILQSKDKGKPRTSTSTICSWAGATPQPDVLSLVRQ